MDWLAGMNRVVELIENNLTQKIKLESLARTAGCSVYEFSRIFSYMAGMSVSQYIRNRRLSQAVFDIQTSDDRLIDIALKYCYESPTTFTRAFKNLHGITPTEARSSGAYLKTYLPITFVLTIKGVNAMDFRIEKMDSFKIVGLSGYEETECTNGDTLTPLWRKFMDEYDPLFWNGGESLYTAPFWQVAAYYDSVDGDKVKTMIGAQFRDQVPVGASVETIPAATWAVFSVASPTGAEFVPEAYARVLTEWLPTSAYMRAQGLPTLEVFPSGDTNALGYRWEIWIPVIRK